MIAEVACPIPVFKTFDYLIPEALLKEASHLMGRRVLIQFGFKKLVGVIYKVKETSDAPLGKLKALNEVMDAEPLLSPQLIQFAEWLSHRYVCSMGEALFALLPPGKSRVKSFPTSAAKNQEEAPFTPEQAPVPTPEQKEAVEKIKIIFEANQSPVILLRGVAAAGKTEVYMAAIQEALSRGKTALYLVPEIGLAEQAAGMLKNRFGPKVLLFHSDMKPSERFENWQRIKRGEIPIVLGPRATILAPLENIGVIIVDEEHESSYKEDRKPRFHVRDAAIERSRLAGAPVIFGGATPSLELYEKTLSGQAMLIEISERAIPAAAPVLRLVDLKQNKAKGLLSTPLVEEMAARFKTREQTILFLNRRGFFRYLKCTKCAWIARCPNCSIALVKHKVPAGYWCHYCSYILLPVTKCPDCGSKELFAGGFGTERIEEEVQTQFPWVHVVRWDRDAVTQRGQQKKIFEDFAEGKYDVLIGTQIVAQGFNFPKVTLVGILDADSQLHIPDFRSAEKTYQLITQVAGRSGRADVTGQVLIQTRHADHYSLIYASKMDYAGFAAKELKFREELNYPPYRHLVQVITGGKKAESEMTRFIAWVDSLKTEEVIAVLGPSTVKKRKGGAQFQVLVKIAKPDFESFLREIPVFLTGHTSTFVVNVDPESLG